MQNFSKVYHLKMVFQDNFLRFTVTICFQKMKYLKNVSFFNHFFQSISYKNKSWVKIKSWAHISDNIAGVVGGS